MRQISKKFIPVAFIGLITSSLLYGTNPYVITSAQGGPLEDELDGVISFAQAQLIKGVSFEAKILDIVTSHTESGWLNEKDQDAYPPGTKIAVVEFTLHNTTDKDVDIFGLFVKAWFENDEQLAAPVTPIKNAPHVQAGYPEYLLDVFNTDKDSWVIPAGEKVTFADSYHIPSTPEPSLNVQIVLPQTGKTDTSHVFKLAC